MNSAHKQGRVKNRIKRLQKKIANNDALISEEVQQATAKKLDPRDWVMLPLNEQNARLKARLSQLT